MFGGVGPLHDGVDVVEGDDGHHRPEDLLCAGGRIGRHVGQNRGPVEEARPLFPPAPRHHGGSRLDGLLDDAVHPFELVVVDEGPDGGVRGQTVTETLLLVGGGCGTGELLGQRSVNVETLGGDAHLAAVAVLGDDPSRGDFSGVDVVEDDHRSVASEF